MNRPAPPVDPHAAMPGETSACMARGELARAAEALDQVQAAAPDHRGTLFQRAVIELAGNRPRPLARCWVARPGWAQASTRRGQLRLRLGEDDGPEAVFREEAVREPGDPRPTAAPTQIPRQHGADFAERVDLLQARRFEVGAFHPGPHRDALAAQHRSGLPAW